MSFTMDGKTACNKLLGDFTDPELGSVRMFRVPNNWNHFLSDHIIHFRVLPISANRTAVRTTWLVHEDAVEGVDYDHPTADRSLDRHQRSGPDPRRTQPSRDPVEGIRAGALRPVRVHAEQFLGMVRAARWPSMPVSRRRAWPPRSSPMDIDAMARTAPRAEGRPGFMALTCIGVRDETPTIKTFTFRVGASRRTSVTRPGRP